MRIVLIAAKKWKKGDRIVCKFDDGDHYIGTVSMVRKSKVYIIFDDGDKVSFGENSKSIIGEGVKKKHKGDIAKKLKTYLLPDSKTSRSNASLKTLFKSFLDLEKEYTSHRRVVDTEIISIGLKFPPTWMKTASILRKDGFKVGKPLRSKMKGVKTGKVKYVPVITHTSAVVEKDGRAFNLEHEVTSWNKSATQSRIILRVQEVSPGEVLRYSPTILVSPASNLIGKITLKKVRNTLVIQHKEWGPLGYLKEWPDGDDEKEDYALTLYSTPFKKNKVSVSKADLEVAPFVSKLSTRKYIILRITEHLQQLIK